MRQVNEKFIKLVDIAKTMKCNMYQFRRDCIVGTDEELASVSLIYIDTELTDEFEACGLCGIMFKATDLSNIFKASENANPGDPLATYLDEFELTRYGMYHGSTCIAETLYSESVTISGAVNRLYTRLNNWPMMFHCNLRDPEYSRFFEILGRKKDDGEAVMAFGYNYQYEMTLFSGIVPITQKDRIEMSIMDEGPHSKHFLVEFNIFKKVPKTKVELHIRKYILYLKLPLASF